MLKERVLEAFSRPTPLVARVLLDSEPLISPNVMATFVVLSRKLYTILDVVLPLPRFVAQFDSKMPYECR